MSSVETLRHLKELFEGLFVIPEGDSISIDDGRYCAQSESIESAHAQGQWEGFLAHHGKTKVFNDFFDSIVTEMVRIGLPYSPSDTVEDILGKLKMGDNDQSPGLKSHNNADQEEVARLNYALSAIRSELNTMALLRKMYSGTEVKESIGRILDSNSF